MFCDYCQQHIDPDDDPCHFNNGGVCEIQLDDFKPRISNMHFTTKQIEEEIAREKRIKRWRRKHPVEHKDNTDVWVKNEKLRKLMCIPKRGIDKNYS